jgi:uncharacterized protein YkwD
MRYPQTVTRALAAGITFLGLAAGTAAPATPSPGAVRDRLFQLINDYRQQNGRGRLQANPTLTGVAQGYAAVEARVDDRKGDEHELDGKKHWYDRLLEAGYHPALDRNRLYIVQENVGVRWNDPDPAQGMFKWWLGSPHHKANILNTSVTEFGVGVAVSRAGNYYFCVDFARPAARP